jgi:hypothetical protein
MQHIADYAPDDRGQTARHHWARLVAAALVCGGTLVVSAACASSPAIPRDLGMPWGATVKDIVSNPQQSAGKTVVVSGEVNRVFGPRWFSIGGEGFGGGEELLVVGPTRIPKLLDNLADSGKVANDLVQVTGRVRLFDVDAIEDEIGEDLPGGDWWRPYDRKPVVVMTDLDITPRVDVVPVVAVPVPVPVAPITDELLIISTPERRSLVGRTVALFGVKVQTVVGRNAFWVGPTPDRQLFVALDPTTTGDREVRAGQTIAVAGVLRAMPTDLAGVRGSWSLTAANEATLAREPLYLAASRDLVRAGTLARR